MSLQAPQEEALVHALIVCVQRFGPLTFSAEQMAAADGMLLRFDIESTNGLRVSVHRRTNPS